MIGEPAGSAGDAGHLSEASFERVRGLVPILCVDVLPRRTGVAGSECLLIRRHDRTGALGWNLIGGRVRIDERLGDAVERHLSETLGDRVSWRGRDWERPDLAAQYPRTGAADGPHDPGQHAVALSYLVELEGEPVAGGEALELGWFAPERLPAAGEFGFGQRAVVDHLLAAAHPD